MRWKRPPAVWGLRAPTARPSLPPHLRSQAHQEVAANFMALSTGTASSSWSPHQVRVLAAMAAVDPRTAAKWLAGHPVTSTCDARLSEAKLRLLGRLDFQL